MGSGVENGQEKQGWSVLLTVFVVGRTGKISKTVSKTALEGTVTVY
jgi:hypothetical protein